MDNVELYIEYLKDDDKGTDTSKKPFGCEGCGSDSLIQDQTLSSLICVSCGCVNNTIIDSNPEWRSYDGEGFNDQSRCNLSINQLLPNSSLGTSLAHTTDSHVKMLQRWNAMPYRERSLNQVFNLIRSKCEKNGMSKRIENDAQIMFKKITESKHTTGKNKGKNVITRGKNRKSVIASCLFAACRRNGHTRLACEVAEMFEVTSDEMNKGYKNFLELIQNYNRTNPVPIEVDMGTSKARHFIQRFCDKMNIVTKCSATALKIAKNIDTLNLAADHNSFSVAAASIMISADIEGLVIDKKKLADVMKISEVTVNKAYKKLVFFRKLLIDDFHVSTLSKILEEKKIEKSIPFVVAKRMRIFGFNTDLDNFKVGIKKSSERELIDELSFLTIDDGDEFLRISNVLNSST